jgi:exodeoxyribonuclease-5
MSNVQTFGHVTFPAVWTLDIYGEEVPMVSLSDEQSKILDQLLDGRRQHRVQTLGGLAGTGKTTLLATLAHELPGWQPCAFTGRAAHVMRTKGIDDARTIHSVIYTPEEQEDGTVTFRLRPRYELADIDGFLVDEASMVSKQLHRDMLSFGKPIIFLGDHGQLPPVGDDVYLMEDPDYRLEEIHRNAGPIAHFAGHLRRGGAAQSFQAEGAVTVVSTKDIDDEDLPGAGQVVCVFNKTRVAINNSIRKQLGHAELLEPGDRVICLRNNRRAGLFNGMTGTVEDVHPVYDTMTFTEDTGDVHEVTFDPATFGQERYAIDFNPEAPHPFDYSWAITCHRAQGGEWEKVTVVEQRCGKWDHERWAYTAASRAKTELVWVTP